MKNIMQLVESGHEVSYGRHEPPLTGYFFSIGEPQQWCEECECGYNCWPDVGHGETILDAFKDALAIHDGEQSTSRYRSKDFLPFAE